MSVQDAYIGYMLGMLAVWVVIFIEDNPRTFVPAMVCSFVPILNMIVAFGMSASFLVRIFINHPPRK